MDEKTIDNSNCGKTSIHGKLKDGDCWGVLRVNCKKWTCPVCGPKNVRKLRKAIISAAEGKGLNRFLTLTLDPSKYEGDSLEYINNCWVKLRVYLSRKYGQKISFIKILEFQKNGQAHFHILIDRYIPIGWIKKSWEAVGGGEIIKLLYVDIHRVAHYLSKYLTKELLFSVPFGKRRYTTSKDIKLFHKDKKKKPSDWYVLMYSIEALYAYSLERKAVFEERRDRAGRLVFFTTRGAIT